MIAIPRAKVEELIKSLEPYMDSTKQIDQFTLKRFKKEALENLKAFPWAGYLALGMIAVLEWDEVGLDAAYQNAIALGNDSRTHVHYANALQLIGKYSEALQLMLIASRMAPENLTILSEAVDFAQSAGRFSTASELQAVYAQRSPERPHGAEESVKNALRILEANSMSEDTLNLCNEIAFKLLRERRVPFVSTRLETDIQDNYMMFYIDIVADESTVERLDEELGLMLFDKVEDFHPDKYWVGYAKADLQV